MRCLIVDDDEICRKFLIRVMGKMGSCDIAMTGLEALHCESLFSPNDFRFLPDSVDDKRSQ